MGRLVLPWRLNILPLGQVAGVSSTEFGMSILLLRCRVVTTFATP